MDYQWSKDTTFLNWWRASNEQKESWSGSAYNFQEKNFLKIIENCVKLVMPRARKTNRIAYSAVFPVFYISKGDIGRLNCTSVGPCLLGFSSKWNRIPAWQADFWLISKWLPTLPYEKFWGPPCGIDVLSNTENPYATANTSSSRIRYQ